jgi:predicted O-linked N-acetylglucosamine transferase (SPINDLY family)
VSAGAVGLGGSGGDPALAQVGKALDLIDAGEFVAAEALCRRVLQKSPTHPHALRVLANALLLQRNLAAGGYYIDFAAKHAPKGDASFLLALARMRKLVAYDEETLALFERALAIEAGLADAAIGQVELLNGLNRFADALREADAFMRRCGAHPTIWHAGVQAMLNLGRAEEANEEATRLVEAFPEFAGARLLRATTNNYAGVRSPQQSLEDARVCGAAMAQQAVRPRGAGGEAPGDGALAARVLVERRPLRVGFISPDLRAHSVAYFLLPLLRNLDRARFHTTCYGTIAAHDAMTQRLMDQACAWRNASMMLPQDVARAVREDGIDVLIELAGHTAHSVLDVLAFRPAPVQATYLGYPATTGHPALGFRIVDELTDPGDAPGPPYDAGAHASERLVRVEGCFLCYEPSDDAPEVSLAPSSREGVVTFGSFNALKKTTRRTLALWARVLRGVPGSRLLLKNSAFQDPGVRADIAERLARAGVERERFEFAAHAPSVREHLGMYARVDVALDTFPYHGTTTTCEALWMGVPVVSLVGDRHASRVGLSVLRAAGLESLATRDEDQYVARAVGLASDAPGLAKLRAGMRERLRASALMDGAGFGKRFGEAIDRMVALHRAGAMGTGGD